MPQVEAWNAEFDRVMPWFEANCSFLDDVGRSAAREPSQWAFRCRPGATGRPTGLSESWLAKYTDRITVSDAVGEAKAETNKSCATLGEDPVPLLGNTPDELRAIKEARP